MYRFRNFIGLLLLFFALLRFIAQFSTNFESAVGVFLLQLWAGQAVYQYLRGGRVTIGPGGLDRDASPWGRTALALASFLLYLLFLSRSIGLMSRVRPIGFLLFFLLASCVPYRSAWEGDRNQFIGKEIDPKLILENGYYGAKFGSYFFHWGVERRFDRIEKERDGVRYYITYGGPCRYSILLDETNVMVSWRYEKSRRSWCVVN